MTSKERQIYYPRNIKKVIISSKEKVIYFAIGFFITMYLAILLGACYSSGATILDSFFRFNEFIIEQHHFVVGFTPATSSYILILELVYSLIVIPILTRPNNFFEGREYGKSEFGKGNIFTEITADHEPNNFIKVNFGNTPHEGDYYINPINYWIAKNIYFSKFWSKLPNLNILVIGPPGSGKTFKLVKLIIAQLLNNLLITDPKGENFKNTGQYLKDNGTDVMAIDIQTEEALSKCTRFNPFRYLRCETDISKLTDILFKATTDPDQHDKDPFFPKMAKKLLKGIFYLMHYTYPIERQNWTEFVKLLDATTIVANKNQMCDTSDPDCIYNIFKKANEEWLAGKYTKGVPQKEPLKGWLDIKDVYSQPAITASNIKATLDTHTEHMKYDCVKKFLSDDEIDITNRFGYGRRTKDDPYGSRKTALFIITDENNHIFDWIPGMIYSIFFNELYRLTDTDHSLKAKLPIPLTFLMDEFANTFVPDNMVDLLTTMRSRGMNVVAIVQTLVQLKKMFPKHELDRICKGVMSVTMIMSGPKDTKECEELSKLFGDTTERKTSTSSNKQGESESRDKLKKPLLSADEIFRLDGDGNVAICFAGNIKPLLEPKGDLRDTPIYPLLVRGSEYSDEPPFSIDFDYLRVTDNDFVIYTDLEEAKQHIKGNIIKIPEEYFDAFIVANDKKMFPKNEDVDLNEFINSVGSALIEEEIENFNLREINVSDLKTIEQLKNIGYNDDQIAAIVNVIKTGLSIKEIIAGFNIEKTAIELKTLADKFLKAKGVTYQNER